MKTLQFIGIPFLIIVLLSTTISFQSCKPDDDPEPDCDTCVVVYKPNIYIYPNENIQLTVELEFPLGGKVLTSIPDYGEGWNITVDTNGLINHNYNYLFYESEQPDVWQKDNGWIIPQSDLEVFFRENMSKYGFHGNEINDFIEYWIPKFNDFEYYAVYPQTFEIINEAIRISFSNPPDNLLRLFYVVEGRNKLNGPLLTDPIIDLNFKRENYFVTEWGVIL